MPTFEDPPLIPYLLFENPWPLTILFVVLAAVLRLIAGQTGNRTVSRIALASFVFGIAVFALAYFVTTTREDVRRVTKTFLKATEGAQPGVAETYIDPDALLLGPSGERIRRVSTVLPELATVRKNYPIESHLISELAVHINDSDNAQAYVALFTQFENGSAPPTTTGWLFTWQRQDAEPEWQLVEVRWLRWQGQEPSERAW